MVPITVVRKHMPKSSSTTLLEFARLMLKLPLRYPQRRRAAVKLLHVPDKLLIKAATSEGYFAQANHLLSTGVTADQLMEFEDAIRVVEHENRATWITHHGDLHLNKNPCCCSESLQHWNTWQCYSRSHQGGDDPAFICASHQKNDGNGLVGHAHHCKIHGSQGDDVEVILDARVLAFCHYSNAKDS